MNQAKRSLKNNPGNNSLEMLIIKKKMMIRDKLQQEGGRKVTFKSSSNMLDMSIVMTSVLQNKIMEIYEEM